MISRNLKIENIILNFVYEVKIVNFGIIKIYELFDESYLFTRDSLTKVTFNYKTDDLDHSITHHLKC